MSVRSGVLAMLIACTALPLSAATRSHVTIGTPVILVDALDPDPGAPPAYVEGGHAVEEFHHHLAPAPISPETRGVATITDDGNAIGGRTDGPASHYLVVGDRYAPSFTFTATPRTRVTVQTTYRLESAIDGEPLDMNDPARAHASFELMVVAFNNFAVDSNGALSYDLLAIDTDSAALTRVHDGASTAQAVGPSNEGLLTVSFDNLSDQPAVFAFRGEMVAWGASPMSPAPEPASAALMLAGLGAVGFISLRRRRARA